MRCPSGRHAHDLHGDPRRLVARIGEAVSGSDARVVLVGHSLGCLAIAWWAAEVRRAVVGKVAGAMLVAPPDVGQQGCGLRPLRFAPVPATPLPFSAVAAASGDDRCTTFSRSRTLADGWGAGFADVGRAGHFNAASALGDWPRTGAASLADRLAANVMPFRNRQRHHFWRSKARLVDAQDAPSSHIPPVH